MTNPDGRITVKPEIVLIEQLLRDIADGLLRVPKFQRPFVWRPDQMIELFDSIERGYPIGSLLVWETDLDVTSLAEISDQRIPQQPKGNVAYLLDGHQRLSTLFGCLMPRSPVTGSADQREWMWNIYRVLGAASDKIRFRHWRKATAPPPHYLPVRSVLRTMDFLAFARNLQNADNLPGNVDDLIGEAEELAQRIKSYQTAVVRLVGGDLERAVRVFQRLNSSGQSMTPDQMASALTYRGDTEESLADRIGGMQGSIADVGFGEIAAITIYRSILAVAGADDVQETRWEALARRIEATLARAVDSTEVALRNAVEFLQKEVGVPLARLVPYNPQIMLLVVFFDKTPNPTPEQIRGLVRWFWVTSWSGYFAGANSTQIKNALLEMREFASNATKLTLDDQVARPFPDRFDTRSARIRAFILWDLREFPQRTDLNGAVVNAVELIARSDSNAYRQIIPKSPRKSHPANRIILPTPPRVSVHRALIELSNSSLLAGHGISEEALRRLHDGDDEGFITARTEFLAQRERAFMKEIGVQLPTEWAGDADIDTE